MAKKSLNQASPTRPVRLLKDVEGYGKRGSIVPIPTGEMRNRWFPHRIAEYLSLQEMRAIRVEGIPVERDYTFGKEQPAEKVKPRAGDASGLEPDFAGTAFVKAREKIVAPDKMDPERGLQLLEIFLPHVLEFYRQPIVEEKPTPEEPPAQEQKLNGPRSVSGAAADLLAARARSSNESATPAGPAMIYGSVSAHDILVFVRQEIARNDEAARVILTENDIKFLDPNAERDEKVKHVGDFTIQIEVKGAKEALKRTVRVIPQET